MKNTTTTATRFDDAMPTANLMEAIATVHEIPEGDSEAACVAHRLGLGQTWGAPYVLDFAPTYGIKAAYYNDAMRVYHVLREVAGQKVYFIRTAPTTLVAMVRHGKR